MLIIKEIECQQLIIVFPIVVKKIHEFSEKPS